MSKPEDSSRPENKTPSAEEPSKGAEAPVAKAPEEKSAPTEITPIEQAKRTIHVGRLVVLGLILGSLIWYLIADRYTPYTSQARLDGYVVGVAPKVAGLVTQVWVENNQRVDAGQKLFQIDTSQYEIALEKAQSDLETTQRQVDAGDAAVEAARANLDAAKANLEKSEKDTTRLERLRADDPGTISLRRLEISRANLEAAKARVKGAEAGVRQAIEAKGGDNDLNNALLKAAQSAVAKAQLDLDNTTVRAEKAGIVTDLQADPGQFAGTGSPVLTIIAIDTVWINAEFTENNLGHMQAGTPVEMTFDAMPGKVFSGSVESIGIGVSSGKSAAPGTLPTIQNNRDWLRQSQRFPVVVKFDLQQDNALIGQIRIGGQATVIAYSSQTGILATLGRWYIRLQSWLSYAY